MDYWNRNEGTLSKLFPTSQSFCTWVGLHKNLSDRIIMQSGLLELIVEEREEYLKNYMKLKVKQ